MKTAEEFISYFAKADDFTVAETVFNGLSAKEQARVRDAMKIVDTARKVHEAPKFSFPDAPVIL